MAEILETILKNEESDVLRPSHLDFEAYLPWALRRMSIFTPINITRVIQDEHCDTKSMRSTRSRKKIIAKPFAEREINIEKQIATHKTSLAARTDYVEKTFSKKVNVLPRKLSSISYVSSTDEELKETVYLTAIYDNANNLIQLKFNTNSHIPIAILKVIGMIIKFQKYVSNVTINRGLCKASVYEISKWLTSNYITDLCLDDAALHDADANYDLLLSNESFITQLSLSRCKINDHIFEKIALKLSHRMPASKTLKILKLSSNEITDKGAKSIAEALKTNRKLAYLNVSDNNITDDGFIAILEVLAEFSVSEKELLESRKRYMSYLKERKLIVSQVVTEIQKGDYDEKSMKSLKNVKKKVPKSASASRLGALSQSSKKNKGAKDMISLLTTEDETEISLLDRAKIIAEARMGEYEDPFVFKNIFRKDDQYYCYGNNNLAYINLAYNDITLVSVKMLLAVLLKQNELNRNPKGLVSVSLEGNCLPANCVELKKIKEIIELNLGKKKAYKA